MQQRGTQQKDKPTGGTGTDQDKTGKVTIGKKSYTQEEFNAMIDRRLTTQSNTLKKTHATEIAKVTAKYGDYDDLKTAATELQQLKDAGKTDMQKLADRLETIEAERAATAKQFEDQIAALQGQNTALEQERTDLVLRTEIVAEATRQGFNDPDDAYGLLDLSKLAVKDGKVDGVEDALKALAKAKSYLLQARGSLGPTHPGRSARDTGETDVQRRARLFGPGETPIGTAGGGVFRPEP